MMDLPLQMTVVPERATAACLGVSYATLRRMRADETGPRSLRLSARRIAYRVVDLHAWLETRLSA